MANLTKKVSSIIKRYVAMLLEPIIGYSRVVLMTKASLLAIAFILTAILVILPFYNSMNKNFRLTFSSIEKSASGDSPVILNPHLQGAADNFTYNVTAKSGVQEKMEKVSLKSLNAEINLKNDGWISMSADEGLFDHSRNAMDIKGNINLFNQDGYEFNTSEASVDMKTNSISGKSAIEGQGPIGTIRADNFLVEDKGNRILLNGRVKVVVFVDNMKNKTKNSQ